MKVETIGKCEIVTGYTPQQWHRLRALDITSTDAAALFGISPYLTPYELWHRKKSSAIVEFEPSERMKWGTRLQDSIAAGIAEDNGWKVRRMDEYIAIPSLRMGASFDCEITLPDGTLALLEIKNVDAMAFKDGWILDGDNIEAPPHIELQVQHQLAVSHHDIAYIGALIGGNRVVLIKRERDNGVIESLYAKISAFWDSIAKNEEPKPDFERDAKFIASLYRYAEPGKVMAMTDAIFGMCAEYRSFKDTAKVAEGLAQAKKAEILTVIGDAEKVVGERFSISAGMIGPQHIEYDREGYRDFRVTQKKIKEIANVRH